MYYRYVYGVSYCTDVFPVVNVYMKEQMTKCRVTLLQKNPFIEYEIPSFKSVLSHKIVFSSEKFDRWDNLIRKILNSNKDDR